MTRYLIQSSAVTPQGQTLRVLPGATITVNGSDGLIATLYSGATGATEIANPVTADEFGAFSFYVEKTPYVDLVVASGSESASERFYTSDIPIVTPEHYGAVGDGTTDDSTAMASFWDAVAAGTKGVLTGTYLMATAYVNTAVAADVSVEFAHGSKLIAGAGISGSLVQLKATVVNTNSLTISGGVVDTSLSTFVEGSGSGTGISATRFDKVTFRDVEFVADQTDTTLWSTWRQNGDSGSTLTDCRDVLYDNCRFTGQPDAGAYPGGNSSDASSSDDGGQISFKACWFENCWAGITIKRQMKNCLVDGCFFIDCRGGVSIVEASDVSPATEVTVCNNYFVRCSRRPLRIQSKGRPANVYGNQFINWGYDRDGTTLMSGGEYAITFEGVQGGIISGNVFEAYAEGTSPVKQTPFAAQCCIRYESYTDPDDTVWPSKNNRHYGNTVKGVANFVSEDTGQGPNTGGENGLIGITTVASFAASGKSSVGYYNSADTGKLLYVSEADSLVIKVNGRALPEYDEGTFSPEIDFGTEPDGGVAYSTQAGNWFRIGNAVTVFFDITFTATWTTTAPAGFFRAPSNLPFRMLSGAEAAGALSGVSGTFPVAAEDVTVQLLSTRTSLQYRQSSGLLTGADIETEGSGASISLAGSITYITDDSF